MEPRLDYYADGAAGIRGMKRIEQFVKESSLEPLLIELVKIRSSQLNGCAFCLDMHTKDARALGEDEARLHMLAAWREAPGYSERERAALAWCESLTLLSETGAPDADYEPLQQHFTDEEIVALSFLIVAINGWNRLAVGFRAKAGDYVSPYAAAAVEAGGQ